MSLVSCVYTTFLRVKISRPVVKADIQYHRSHLAQLYERSKSLFGELAVKRQTLADAELNAKCAVIHEDTLEQQKEEQLRERNNRKDRLVCS